MGKRSKGTTASGKKASVTETSSHINKSTVICTSLVVAALAYALFHLFSNGAHLDWIYSSSASIQVERYVMNDSISYQ